MEDFCDPYLKLYLPLYELDGSSFMSKDAYGHLCTVTGALWRPNGRWFDKTSDIITCGNIGTARTLCFWFKPDTTTESILEEIDDVGVTINAGSMVYGSWDNCFVDGVDIDTATKNWHYIALTSTTDVDVSAFRLGLVNVTYFGGLIGEVLVYSRELTPQEILHNYLSTKWRYK